jgi:hypothetical protein
MRRFLFALLAALALSSPAQARFFTQPELDALVAPIALYPDGLISDVLVAATHPDQVNAAARLPKGAPADEAWDPAVKSLLSFPDILSRMVDSPQWTRDLGEAFLAQEPHVLDTVQSLRRRAQAQGTLTSNDQVSVQQEGRAIVVQPRTEVIYAPYYDPYVVYGAWWWPAYRPVYWRPWVVVPVVVSAGFFFARPDWHARRVVVVNKVGNFNVQRNVVVRQPARVDRRIEVRDYHRVPESQRQPIVRSGPQSRTAMPAATRFSESRPPQQQSRPPQQQQPHFAANADPRRGGEVRGGGEMRGGGEIRGSGEMRGGAPRGGSGGGQHGGGRRG